MKKVAKKRLGRPPGRKAPHRPVVSARVPEELYERIKDEAQKAGRTMGEELVWRANSSYEWEKAFGDAQKVRDDAFSETRKVLNDAKKVTALGTLVAIEAPDSAAFSGITLDTLEELLERAASRALEKSKSRRES